MTAMAMAMAVPVPETRGYAYAGLCGTCANMPGCGFYRGPDPVIECEEFTIGEATTSRASAPGSRRPSIPLRNALADETPLSGICANCAERAHCALRKPGRVTWHCEEYR